MINTYTIPRKPRFAKRSAAQEPVATSGETNHSIPRPRKKPRDNVVIEDDASKQRSKSGNVAAAVHKDAPVYRKIKCGRTVGYPITVMQGGNSQHEAILLNCNINPEDYLKQFTGRKVKIRWLHAGYNDHTNAATIRLKEFGAARPVRHAAARCSGLLSRMNDNGTVDEDDDVPILKESKMDQLEKKNDVDESHGNEVHIDREDIDQPLKVSAAAAGDEDSSIEAEEVIEDGPNDDTYQRTSIKTEDIETDDEAPKSMISGFKTEDIETDDEVLKSKMSGIKAEEIETDDEDEVEVLKSNMPGIKADDIETDDDDEVLKSNLPGIKADDIETDDEAPKSLTSGYKTEDIETDDEDMAARYKIAGKPTPDPDDSSIEEGEIIEDGPNDKTYMGKTYYDEDKAGKQRLEQVTRGESAFVDWYASASASLNETSRTLPFDSSQDLAFSSHNKRMIIHKKFPPRFNNNQSAYELIQLAYDNLYQLTDTAVAAFWNKLSRQIGVSSRNQFEYSKMKSSLIGIFHHTLNELRSFNAKNLTNTIYNIFKLLGSLRNLKKYRQLSCETVLRELLLDDDKRPRYHIFQSFADSSLVRLDQFNPQDFSNLVWSFGKAGISNQRLFDEVAEIIVHRRDLNSFNPQALANTIWAYASLQVPNQSLFDKVAKHIARLDDFSRFPLEKFSSQELSNTLMAFAKVGVYDQNLFEKVGSHVEELGSLHNWNPQELSTLVWAYAEVGGRIGRPNVGVFEKVANHIAGLRSLASFAAQSLSTVFWAYTTVGILHQRLFNRMMDHTIGLDKLDGFHSISIANITWACSRKYKVEYEGELFEDTNTKQKHRHIMLFQKIAQHIVEHDNFDRFDTLHLSRIAEAYASAKICDARLFQRLSLASIQRRDEFGPQGIANILWAFASMNLIKRELFEAFLPALVKKFDSLNSLDLATTAWAFAVADIDAPSLFNQRFLDKCVEKESELDESHLSRLHQWHLWQTKEKIRGGLPEDLCERCHKLFVERARTKSKFQHSIATTLSSMGLELKETVLDSGYGVDALVVVNGKAVGIEVDGQFHFIGWTNSLLGNTILKRRQITAVDRIEHISVTHWKWTNLGMDLTKRQRYLRALLGL